MIILSITQINSKSNLNRECLEHLFSCLVRE